MKICYIFSNIDLRKITGQPGISFCLIEKAQKQNFDVYIISNYQNDSDHHELNQFNCLLIKGSSNLKTYILNGYKIIKYLRRIKPDIIHIQGTLLIPFSYFLNKFVGANLICTLLERTDHLNNFQKRLLVYSIKKIHFCFVLSPSKKERLIEFGVPKEKIIVTYLGLRDSFIKEIEHQQNYEYDIFYYGDISKERGFDLLCRLAQAAPGWRFKFLIRWDKEKFNEISKLDNISCHFSLVNEEELRQMVLKSKIVILPFRRMGVQPPVSLLEVMALGKCVLTTLLPGNLHFLKDEENAILVSDESSVDKILKKLEFLLNNLGAIEQIGRKARETILRYYTLSEYQKVFLVYKIISQNFYEWRMFGNAGGDFISRKEIDILLNLLQPESGDNVLDVGTGSGRFARTIVKNSDAKIIGLDPDKKILQEGEILSKVYLSENQKARYHTVLGDGQNIKFDDNTFDKVFSFRALKYYSNPYKGASELCRVLRKGGILVLEITNTQSWESIVKHFLPKLTNSPHTHFWEKNMGYFNPGHIKEYLLGKGMIIIDEKPLHKIPPFLYSKFKNQHINCLLDMLDKILLKITPKYLFSKSIVLKCKKL